MDLEDVDKASPKESDTFPYDQKLFALMVRSLLPEFPGAELDELEKSTIVSTLLER